MYKLKSNQNGFHVIEIIIALVVLGAIGFVGWKVMGSDDKQSNSSTTTSSGKKAGPFVEWSYNGSTWAAQDAPKCEEPLRVLAPIDLSKADSKLLPGQVRGGDYKPHGGLGLNYSKHKNKVDVVNMRDAFLYRGSRYKEAGEVQYMFDFMDSCGILYRYDHLLTLSDDFAKYADMLPEPQTDDSRTQPFNDHPFVAAGTVIATEVGFRNMQNPGFDIGVYDLRQPNDESKTNLFKTDSKRVQDKEQSYFSVCWFDLLNDNDKQLVRALPLRNSQENTSDFCDV